MHSVDGQFGVYNAPSVPSYSFNAPSIFPIYSDSGCGLSTGGCFNCDVQWSDGTSFVAPQPSMYQTVTQTRMVPVTRYRKEMRNRQVPYTTYRTQNYTVRNALGRLQTRQRRVPTTQMRSESYEVDVPYIEQVAQTYNILVPITPTYNTAGPVALPDPEVDEDTVGLTVKLNISNDLTAIKAVISKKSDVAVNKRFNVQSSNVESERATGLTLTYTVTDLDVPTLSGKFKFEFSDIDVLLGSLSMSRTITSGSVDEDKLRQAAGELRNNLRGLASNVEPQSDTSVVARGASPVKTWTSKDGRVTTGEVLVFDGAIVKFKRADGKQFNARIELFSDKDQAKIRTLATKLNSEKSDSQVAGLALVSQ